MKEKKLPPFEKARRNVEKFVESAELIHTLLGLIPVMESVEEIPEEEREVVLGIVDKTLMVLSRNIERGGQEWN